MRIFTVGEDTEAGAQALRSRDWKDKQDNTVDDFAAVSDNSLTGPTDSLVFLGHGNTEEFGGYTPKAFVKKLNKIVPENRRRHINHIYLIGCEIGKQTDQGCVAQSIANELGNNGYSNVMVHAIASPDRMTKDDVWYVNITTRVGVGPGYNILNPPKLGDIKAVKLDGRLARRCDELREIVDNNRLPVRAKLEAHRELDVILNEEKLVIHTCDPKTELDKPWHTFRPGESFQQRLARLDRNPVVQQYQQDQADRDHAVDVLQDQIAHLKGKGKKDDRISILEDLIKDLLKNDASQWKAQAKNVLAGLEVDSPHLTGFVTDKAVSTTYKLVKGLSEGKFPEEKAAKHKDRKDKHHKEEKPKQRFVPADEPYSSGSDTSGSEKSSPRRDTASDDEAPLMQRVDVSNNQNLAEARRQLEQQRSRLRDEIKDRERSCLSFFYPSTKKDKMVEIERLLANRDVRSFSNALDTARTNKVLTAGWFGSRTKNLLENIAAGNAARGIETPVAPEQRKKGM